MRLSFFVPGKPKAQGSMAAFALPPVVKAIRALASSGRWDAVYGVINKYIVVKQNDKVKAWRNVVSAVAKKAMNGQRPIEGPVWIKTVFHLKRPKNHYRTGKFSHLLRDDAPKYPINKGTGDADKHLRSVLDALTDIVYVDDCQVVYPVSPKIYAETEGVHVTLTDEEPKGSK
jgi:Holliday junction resolvase RusA-like endonuclease